MAAKISSSPAEAALELPSLAPDAKYLSEAEGVSVALSKQRRPSGSPALPAKPLPFPPPPPAQAVSLLPPIHSPAATTAAAPHLVNPGAAGAIYSMSQYISPLLQVMTNFLVT